MSDLMLRLKKKSQIQEYNNFVLTPDFTRADCAENWLSSIYGEGKLAKAHSLDPARDN